MQLIFVRELLEWRLIYKYMFKCLGNKKISNPLLLVNPVFFYISSGILDS
jgi:hypothetical protein